MLRIILVFFLISIISLSSVGMPVYTHVCNGMGKSWVSFFVSPKACCTKAPAKQHIACCKPSEDLIKIPQIKKTPCCEDKITFEDSAIDLISSVQSLLEKETQYSNPAFFWNHEGGDFLFSVNQTEQSVHKIPITRYGRSLLIFEQLFLC